MCIPTRYETGKKKVKYKPYESAAEETDATLNNSYGNFAK